VLVVPALGTDEAAWPAQSGQVVEAVLLASESGLELQAGLGEVIEHEGTITQAPAKSMSFMRKNNILGVGGGKCIPQ
jgi:hypothetical protein